ncbi:MAG: YcfL family protein [Phycisphaerales bacterium]|jgi:uncharacterized protein YcfL|nr:YcfL family protein [Phycisphaerales bacterium]
MNTPALRSITLAAILAAGSVLATGCNSQPRVNTTEAAEKGGEPKIVKDNRLVFDSNLNNNVALVGVAEGTSASGLKSVEAEVFNRSRSRQAIRYRFEWFGPDGLAISSGTSVYRDRALLGGERARLTAVAPNDRAVDWQLEIIRAR